MNNINKLLGNRRNRIFLQVLVALVIYILLSIIVPPWIAFIPAAGVAYLIGKVAEGYQVPFTPPLNASGVLTLRDDAQRIAILRNFVVGKVANGCRVELQDDFSAVLVSGKRPNHILHLLLSIVTLGIWLIVWIIIAMTSKEHRDLYRIDEYGVIT
jgi:hypothetical protein